MASYTVVDLPFARWGEVTGPDAIDGPLKGMQLAEGSLTYCPAVEDATGKILGYWPIFPAVHAEPLFLDPSVRSNVAVARQLIAAVLAIFQQHTIPYAFGIIGDADVEQTGPMAETFGFTRVPGQLYALKVPGVASGGE